ncbi:phospholipid-translocating P-type ATPase, flippase [Ostertagia ostertagi]
MIILSVSAIKEIFEDIKRRRADHKVNSFKTLVLENNAWQSTNWRDVEVGDLVRVDNDQLFPADLLLLSSSEPQGMCYIETSNLDGENNLKIKQKKCRRRKVCVTVILMFVALTSVVAEQHYRSTSSLVTLDTLSDFEAKVECEHPSRHVTEFSGNLIIEEAKPFGIDQLLLRGARLKNTPWIFGAVIYTGHDSKLMMNSKTAPLKSGTVDKKTNTRIIFLFLVLVALAIISAIGAEIWRGSHLPQAWYISFLQNDSRTSFPWHVLTFFILYNNLIPISLQVTLEIVRFFQVRLFFLLLNVRRTMLHPLQAGYINADQEMYDANSDSCAIARTSNLNEELGLVKYVMSDKTGTLTRNVMKFKRVSVAGRLFGDNETDEFDDDSLVEEYRYAPLTKTGSQIRELLTMMAVCHTVVPEDKDGELSYQCSSPDEGALVRGAAAQGFVFHTRKPKKVLGEDEAYEVLDVIDFTSDRKRMSVVVRDPSGRIKLYTKGADTVIFERLVDGSEAVIDSCHAHLEDFASYGYRTLCFAMREIKEQIIAAHSCALCHQNTELLIVDKDTYEDTYTKLVQLVNRSKQLIKEEKEFAMIIDGKSLVHALVSECRTYFGELALKCRAVVCCRMSPMQKAEVVEMVRGLGNHVVMAVGDGANDVAMIQAANVGIGISGEEGLQAASASDYAIPRFHFLRRLLLQFFLWIGMALVHSLSLFFLSYGFLDSIVGLFVVVTVCLKALLECDSWTWPIVAACFGSILLWLLFLPLYAAVFPTISSRIGGDMAGMAYIMMSSTLFWCALIFIPCATLIWDLVIKSIFTITLPTPREMAVMQLKGTTSSPGFERLASKSARVSAAKSPPKENGVGSHSEPLRETTRLHGHDNPALEYGSTEMVMFGLPNSSDSSNITLTLSTVLENVRLLRDSLRSERRLSDSSLSLAEQARYGYAFSQDETGAMAQTELVRNADSTVAKPSGL